jgi:hypothetical protein
MGHVLEREAAGCVLHGAPQALEVLVAALGVFGQQSALLLLPCWPSPAAAAGVIRLDCARTTQAGV